MRTMRTTIAAVAILAATALPAAAASTATRPPIKDCGDISTLDSKSGGGFFLGAITAQGGSCKNARKVAASVAKSSSCKTTGSCKAGTYSCTLAKAGKELTLVRCENGRQTAFVRFEFGS